MTPIEIHEFSTGINVQGTPDNWWSVGFSGEYMNSTLSYIPKAVQQDIAADLFYLAEFAIQRKPAIIGREVKLGQEEWSVLAVITHANDESGRGISVSRYFLTKGLGRILDLIFYHSKKTRDLIQRDPQLKGKIENWLVFDPFDSKKVGNKEIYDPKDTKKVDVLKDFLNPEILQLLDDKEALIQTTLIPSTTMTQKGKRIPIKAIHQLAEKKAEKLGQLVSWAYDVEGLKTPHDFLVIYPVAATTPAALPPSNSNLNPVVNLSGANAPNAVDQGVSSPQLPIFPNPQNISSVNDSHSSATTTTPQGSPVTSHDNSQPSNFSNTAINSNPVTNSAGHSSPTSATSNIPSNSSHLSDADRYFQESLNKKTAPPPRVEGQHEIYNIIRNWINDNAPTLSDVQTIENAFKNTTLYDDKFWIESILEPLDLKDAMDDKTYPHIYFYLCLFGDALIIPEKVLEFEDWISYLPKKQKKTVYEWLEKFSLGIQSQLSRIAPNRPTETAIFERVKTAVGILIDENNPSTDLKSPILPDALKKLYSIISQLSTPKTNPLNFNRSKTSRVRKWFLTEAKGLWSLCYTQYHDLAWNFGETFKQKLWQDIKQIAINLEDATDNCTKKYNIGRYRIQNDRERMNATLKRDYELTYASSNLLCLNDPNLQGLKQYFIDLIWYNQGKSKSESLNLSDSNEKLLTDLAKVFGAMIKYKEDHKMNPNIDYDYKLLAVITQILQGSVPTDLWKKCDFTVNLGKKDKIDLVPKDVKVNIISLERKPLWFEPFIRYLIPLIIAILLLWTSFSVYQILALSKELKLMNELTLPDGLDQIVNDLDQHQNIDKRKSKQAIIKLFKLRKPLLDQEEINWKQLIKSYQTTKEIQSTGLVGTNPNSQTRQAIINDIKASLGLLSPPSPSPSVSPSPSPSVSLSPSVSPSPSPSVSPSSSPTVDPNWRINVNSLNAIVDDQAPDESEKGRRQGMIVQILGFPEGTLYEDIIKQEKSQELKEKIQNFQKANFTWDIYDGLISNDGDTYNKLKSLVLHTSSTSSSSPPSNPPSSPPAH